MIKKHKKLSIFITVMVLMVLFLYWQNNDIVITNITYSSEKVTDDFNGYKIVQISDLHNKNFGRNQGGLLKKIKSISPDIIVVTGDLIDGRHPDIEISMDFIKGALEMAPVYYVTGNHENFSGKYELLQEQLISAGVIMMDNTKMEVTANASKINLFGVTDPSFSSEMGTHYEHENLVNRELENLGVEDGEILNILLSHRPELIDIYAKYKFDLVFTGHAHGGQFRLPFIGGFVAPGQGIFPKYTSGTYKVGDMTEIVSRGLGNSIIPVRVFNRPEIIVCTLRN